MQRLWCLTALGILLTASACGTSTTAEPAAAKDTPVADSAAKAKPETKAAEAPAKPAIAPEKVVEAKPPEPPPEPPPPLREHGVSGLLASVPKLLWRSADLVEDEWYRIKNVADLAEQAEALRVARLHQTACKGLVDVRNVDLETTPFGFRDDVRGRTWARPVVARILTRSMELLRKQLPDRIVTVGDVSQPGCGQLEHGAIVRLLSDDAPPLVTRPGAPGYLEPVGAATTLVNQARLLYGVPTVVELQEGRDLRKTRESYRTSFPDEPVMVRHQILAQGKTKEGKLLIKTVSRRYRATAPPSEDDVKGFGKAVTKLMRAGAVVEQRQVPTWDPDTGEMQKVWLQRWASARLKQQMEVVSTKKFHRKLDLGAVIQVRRARWQNRKPGSFRGETLWVAHAHADETGVTKRHWHRWKKLYEAGHITHLAGRDADLSYVTTDNTSHFRVDMDAIDVSATWKWFKAMKVAAKEAGVAIDRIIVDRKVKRLFIKGLPKKERRTPLWRTIRVVSGHDGHHHVRFTRAKRTLEKKAVSYLKRSFGLKIPSFGL